MRARNVRLDFDRLDVRLVLDASGAGMVSGANLGASLQAIVGTDGGSSNLQDMLETLDWYLPGTPPPDTSDPLTITVPWDLIN